MAHRMRGGADALKALKAAAEAAAEGAGPSLGVALGESSGTATDLFTLLRMGSFRAAEISSPESTEGCAELYQLAVIARVHLDHWIAAFERDHAGPVH